MDYGMFTTTGNDQVHNIVRAVIDSGITGQHAWETAYMALDTLTQWSDTAEATDSEVRDSVHFELHMAGLFDDDPITEFWFFV